MTTLSSRAYAALSWSCDVAGAATLDPSRDFSDAQLQEWLLAAGIADDLTDEEMTRMEYPPIPAHRWPALRRRVAFRRLFRGPLRPLMQWCIVCLMALGVALAVGSAFRPGLAWATPYALLIMGLSGAVAELGELFR